MYHEVKPSSARARSLATYRARSIDLSLILRGVFAIAVVFWHTWGSPNADVIPTFLNVPGRISVWIFFGLSGYVISYGFLSGRRGMSRTGLTEFFVHRAARILPLFWLLSVVAIAISLFHPPEKPLSWQSLAASLTAFQWSHTSYVVGVFWTLGIEIQFYLVAPVLVALLLRYERLFPAGILAAWLALLLVSTGDNRTMIGNLQHFLVGIMVAAAYSSDRSNAIFERASVGWAVAGFGIACLLGGASIYQTSIFWYGAGALLTDLAIASLLMAHCVLERSKVPANPLAALLMSIGTIAYGIYAWHGVALLLPWFRPRFLETLALSMFLATCSYLLFEVPIMTRAKAWLAWRQRELELNPTRS